ncbi:hypothetical protein [Paenibacillus donghaensis]|uniref:Uncharacterized protein n=1 Tax=Paenibacillus donghaensis TaxID=414771 RepID=A0A2Z2KDX5_9BACL|nr:hypothetical protein [Paenibacillus donghaensis]ASA24946.1 hypothetical protein B9T62_31845 [Paenibacillus donghaensis]
MIALTKKEIESISKLISEHFNEYISKYEAAKYPEEPYKKWLSAFSEPKSVEIDDIRQVMEWKHGHYGKTSFVPAHKVIAKLQKYWPEFADVGQCDLNSTFTFWDAQLTGHQSFTTVAFLAHLMNSEQVGLIDPHSFRTMNYLMSTIREDWVWKRNPMGMDDVQSFSQFLRALNPAVKELKSNIRELNKFLMMFGKHKIKTVPVSRSKVAPALSKKHDWSIFKSDVFDLDKITLRANADLLFVICIAFTIFRRGQC